MTAARLLVFLRQLLAVIGEHATPTSVDIAAATGSYSLAIEAAPSHRARRRASPRGFFEGTG